MRSAIDLAVTAAWVVCGLTGTAFATVTAPIPEPASIGLLAVGVAAAAWVKFRRRK